MNRIAEGIYEWTDKVHMGAVVFPARCLVMDTGQGLLIWSPLHIHEDLKKEIDQLGTVKWIMAPNPFHHLYIESAKDLWPEAKLLGPSKLIQDKPTLNWSGQPGEEDLGQIEVHRCHASAKVDEYLVYHRPSQTVVVTDLIFHMERPHNFVTWMVLKMANALSPSQGVPRVSRLLKFMSKDRGAFQTALHWIREKSPTMIVPAHGEALNQNPVERVFEAYRHRFGNTFI